MHDVTRIFATLLFLGALGGCSYNATYPLPASPPPASLWTPLKQCADAANLTAVQHSDSVNVQYEGTTWFQYMQNEGRFELVIILDESVPEEHKPDAMRAAKAKADEIYQCATAASSTAASAPAAGG